MFSRYIQYQFVRKWLPMMDNGVTLRSLFYSKRFGMGKDAKLDNQGTLSKRPLISVIFKKWFSGRVEWLKIENGADKVSNAYTALCLAPLQCNKKLNIFTLKIYYFLRASQFSVSYTGQVYSIRQALLFFRRPDCTQGNRHLSVGFPYC